MNKYFLERYGLIIGGSILFALGNNLFITPMGFYSCGMVGISQILRTIFVDYIGIQVPKGFELAGIINFALNVPMFVLAYKSISKYFFIRTVVSLITQTIFFSLIPIPAVPIIDDPLTACIIGGIITGVGIGLVLRASSTAGGIDILGFYFMMKFKDFSIGKLSIIVNAVVYTICAVMFNVQVAIYSILFIVVYSMAVDKIHVQNIKIMATVVTTVPDLPKLIAHEIRRGVTFWDGTGAYTDGDKKVLMTVVSKYELAAMERVIAKVDPKAFIVCSEGTQVKGNFAKHL